MGTRFGSSIRGLATVADGPPSSVKPAESTVSFHLRKGRENGSVQSTGGLSSRAKGNALMRSILFLELGNR